MLVCLYAHKYRCIFALNSRKQVLCINICCRCAGTSSSAIGAELTISSALPRFVKLNKEELGLLRNLMGCSGEKNDIKFCRRLMHEYVIKLVCLTRGEDGSLLMDESDYYNHPSYKISVADTVGAGDAFTAAMVIKYLDGRTLEEMSNSANRLGS